MKNFIFRVTGALIFGALCALVTLSLLTYSPLDRSLLFDSSKDLLTLNACGKLGANLAGVLLFIFGNSALLLVPILLLLFANILGCFTLQKNRFRLLSLLALLLEFCAIENYLSFNYLPKIYPGGTLGISINRALFIFFDPFCVGLFLFVSLWATIVLAEGFKSVNYVKPFGKIISNLLAKIFNKILILKSKLETFIDTNFNRTDIEDNDPLAREIEQIFSDPFWSNKETSLNLEPDLDINSLNISSLKNNLDSNLQTNLGANLSSNNSQNNNLNTIKPLRKTKSYKLPFNLFLKSKSDSKKNYSTGKEQDQASQLELKLNKFDIAGKVVSITSGPLVTLYEYAPEANIKISTILAREDDLALALEALSLRIIAPIPGKSVIGFEVAHPNSQAILFSDIISQAKEQISNISNVSLPLLLGVNTQGAPVVADLVKLPHLLLAGTTGSGKSVAVQNMLMTLLCSRTPDLVKLILIDPKRLELSVYQDIGHLLFPVITEAKQALAVLNWALGIMEDRYSILAEAGVKNCLEYHSLSEDNRYDMPFIVIVIDELADLMMTAGKDLEIALVRLAQMARASGIHLITATQRPSVDVVTGLIKVNFPSRLACKVASKTDSRTILDTGGAEKLLGRGDMLFLNSNGVLQRIHGAYVSSQEIEQVADAIRSQGKPEYEDLDILLCQDSKKDYDSSFDSKDELFDKAVEFIRTRQDVSISLIQRVFRIGYNRSARLIDQLEASGHIMPPTGSKMRKVNSINLQD